jgi:serine/threonine-protein kinase RsbT
VEGDVPTDVRVRITSAADLVNARQQGRALAGSIGFTGTDLTVIATAISEIARNILEYARRGDIGMRTCNGPGGRDGIEIVATDDGPGIANIPLAMQDGYSTGKGLGLGLPGTKRLMDEFTVESDRSHGTTIRMVKWLTSSRG